MFMNLNSFDIESVDICVVILHYNDVELSNKYINNLKQLHWNNISHHFIIVDNCSPDGSGVYLKELFDLDNSVTVLLSKDNLGFARGNNIGITYVEEHFKASLVIVSNSDIIIEDENFPQKLWHIYSKNQASVIGPDIFSVNKDIHQSPIDQHVYSRHELYSFMKKIDLKLLMLRVIRFFHIYDVLSTIKKITGRTTGKEGIDYTKVQNDVVIHGAFFILTKTYLEEFPEGLYSKTFLYMEEYILAYLCTKRKLNILYTPELKVVHLDGYSTLNQKLNRCNKYIFELEETKNSCQHFLKIMEEDY